MGTWRSETTQRNRIGMWRKSGISEWDQKVTIKQAEEQPGDSGEQGDPEAEMNIIKAPQSTSFPPSKYHFLFREQEWEGDHSSDISFILGTKEKSIGMETRNSKVDVVLVLVPKGWVLITGPYPMTWKSPFTPSAFIISTENSGWWLICPLISTQTSSLSIRSVTYQLSPSPAGRTTISSLVPQL